MVYTTVNIGELKRRKDIDFSTIRATASPYMARAGEALEMIPNERFRGYIDQLSISREERLVLGCVNYLMFATSMQVYWMLSDCDIEQDEIHKILTKMYHAGYLHKMQFKSEKGISSFKVYALTGNRGYCLYKSVFGGRANSKRDYYEREDLAVRVKQILSANQLMAQLISVKESGIPSHCQVFSIGRIFQKPMLMRTIGFVELEESPYWVEPVRRNENYLSSFEDRLDRFKYFQKNYKRIDEIYGSKINSKPKMIVIAEDEEHMKELMACVAEREIPHVVFTHDMSLIGKWEEAFSVI